MNKLFRHSAYTREIDVLKSKLATDNTAIQNATLNNKIAHEGVRQAKQGFVLGLSASVGDSRNQFTAGELTGSATL